MNGKLLVPIAILGLVGCNLQDPLSAPPPIVVNVNNTNSTTGTTTNNHTTAQSNNNQGDPLEVVETSPQADATGVDPNVQIEITFSAEIDPISVDPDTFSVHDPSGIAVPVTFAVDHTVATVTPESPLMPATTYRVDVAPTVASRDGGMLAAEFSWSFETVGPLRVVSMDPPDEADGVEIATPLVFTMSADVDPASVTDNSIRVVADTWIEGQFQPDVPGTVEVAGAVLTFRPNGDEWQEYHTGYTITLGPVRGAAGEPAGPYPTTSFRTVFWDPAYVYALHTEALDLQRALSTETSGLSIMTSPLDLASEWYFGDFPDGYSFMQNLRDQTALNLESGDGAGASYMSAPAPPPNYFSGQAWRAVYVSAREMGSTQRRGDSPGVYYMESLFQGPDKALRTYQEPASGLLRVRMEPKAVNLDQVWWFERLGRR